MIPGTQRSRFVVLTIVVVLVGVGFLLRATLSSDRAARPDAMGVAPPANATPVVRNGAIASNPRYPWARDAQAATLARTRLAFEQATDLQAFFRRALTTPESGGIYYAKNAMMRCVSLRMARAGPRATELQSGTAEALAAAPAKLDAELARCNGLGDPTSFPTLGSALDRSGSDPIMRLVNAEMQARPKRAQMSFDDAAQMMQRATELGDPYFLGESMRNLGSAARTFDGAPLDGGVRMGLASRSYVIECDLGADCTHDGGSLGACYRSGDCAPMAQRLIRPVDFVKRDPVTLVQDVAELTNAAREGTLSGRYGK